MSAHIVQHALLLSLALFTIGAVGVFLRRNIITVFMCVELMLNAVNLAFIAFSRAWGTLDGEVLVFFVLTVAAAEAGWAWPSSSRYTGTRTRWTWTPSTS